MAHLEIDAGEVEADVDAGLDVDLEESDDLEASAGDADVGLDDNGDEELNAGGNQDVGISAGLDDELEADNEVDEDAYAGLDEDAEVDGDQPEDIDVCLHIHNRGDKSGYMDVELDE